MRRSMITGLAAAMMLAVGLAANGSEMGKACTRPSTCPSCEKKAVVLNAIGDKGRTVKVTREEMACGECKSALANLVSKGRMEHTCAACPEVKDHCDMH